MLFFIFYVAGIIAAGLIFEFVAFAESKPITMGITKKGSAYRLHGLVHIFRGKDKNPLLTMSLSEAKELQEDLASVLKEN